MVKVVYVSYLVEKFGMYCGKVLLILFVVFLVKELNLLGDVVVL